MQAAFFLCLDALCMNCVSYIAMLHISWTVHVHVQYARYWQCNISDIGILSFDLIGLHAAKSGITKIFPSLILIVSE